MRLSEASLSLVESGSNVSEEDQVLDCRGEMLFTVQVDTNWFCQIKLVWAGIQLRMIWRLRLNLMFMNSMRTTLNR